MNKNPLKEVFGIFNKLAPQQKVLLGIVAGVTIILMIVLFGYLNQPKYSVLYSNLNEEDAAKIIEQLSSQKIPYKFENSARTILVPADNVYETRLQMAAKGIPASGFVGYEIFDKSTLGMSEFMQRLNYKRALEGELSRTIVQQQGIEAARVHIVMPQKSVFKEEEKAPSASIVLKLQNGFSMDRSSVNAILNLVASSVEGLKQNRVALLDTKGHLLSKEYEENDLNIATSKQYELKQSIENYLTQKAQNMLDNVVGFGNSMVQVDAELDFDQVEKTMETYDPDSQIAISEQSIKTENIGSNMVDSTSQISENSTINYEISKTIQKVIQGAGTIKKLSVAAVINEVPVKTKVGEETKVEFQPRAVEQLQKLENLVKNSVGYNEQRKDNFSLVSIPFETQSIAEDSINEYPDGGILDLKNYNELINIALVIIGIIASLLMLKSLLSKVKKEKILIGTVSNNEFEFAGAETGSSAKLPPSQMVNPNKRKELLPLGNLEDELSDEAAIKKNQQDKIINYVSKNPVDAAKLINVWLHEDELS